jgi:ABC-type multidrug transport system ATPase subunit
MCKVTTVLANCDLSLQRDTPAEKLSGGQKRKLSVAIALIGSPKVSKFLLL